MTRLLVRRADEAQVDREGDDGDADQQDQVRDEIAEAPPLNHARSPPQLHGLADLRRHGGQRRRGTAASELSRPFARWRARRIADHAATGRERRGTRRKRATPAAPAGGVEMRRPVRLGAACRAAPCRAPAPSSSRSRPRRRGARRSWSSRICAMAPAAPARSRWWRGSSSPVSRAKSGRKAASAAMLPPWPLTISTRLKPCRSMLLQEAQQHGAIGRDVEREGAAEGHVMLGHAAPQRRRDHDRHLAGDRLGRRLAHALAQDGVDADRQVRPVLLHGRHRQQHDGTGLRLVAQVGGGQLLPHHGLRHQ